MLRIKNTHSHTQSHRLRSNRPFARWPSACTSILCRVCSDPNQPRNTHTHTSEGGRDDRWVPYHAETQETRQGAKGNSRTAFAAPTGMEPQLGRSRSMRSAAAVRQRAILVFKLSLSLSYILDADILEQAPSSSLDSARRCDERRACFLKKAWAGRRAGGRAVRNGVCVCVTATRDHWVCIINRRSKKKVGFGASRLFG